MVATGRINCGFWEKCQTVTRLAFPSMITLMQMISRGLALAHSRSLNGFS